MAKKKIPEPIKFSPYQEAQKLGAIPGAGTGGINWSYFVFPTKELAEKFAEACNTNDYRTRSLHRQEKDGNWAIQYHHYQD